MTINAYAAPIKYAGDGSTSSFAFTWPVNEPDTGDAHDIVVVLVTSAGAETTLTEGTGTTQYSVTVATYPGAGSITYPASGSARLPSGDYLILRRVLPYDQPLDLKNQGAYVPETLERELDELQMAIQQLREEIDRCLQVKLGDKEVNSASPDLPVLVAGEFVKVNATADGFELTGSASAATATPSSATPQNVSTAGAAGSSTDYSRADHVHAIGTAADVLSDTTPQLGGNLDANGQNILIDGGNFIGDESGNEQIKFATTASAVNELTVTNAATGNGPELKASGGDTDVNLVLSPQGAGVVDINGPSTLGGNLDVAGNSIVSSSAGAITITPDTTGDIILDGQKWPQADGISGQVLITDGAGQLQWQGNIGTQYTQATTDATPTVVASVSMPSNSAKMVHVEGVAVRTDTYAEAMGFEVHNVVLNDGGTTTAGTQAGSIIDSTPVSWNVTITANDTTDVAEITVTGAAATNISWVVHVYWEDVS